MSYKNTILVKCRNKREFTFHLTDRLTSIQVDIYKFGDPKRKETIGYWSKANKWFERICRPTEWELASHVIESILRYESFIKTLYYTTLTITPIGKQTILKRCINGAGEM